MVGYILLSIAIVCDYFIIKSTIKTYHYMKECKRKAKVWDACIK